MSTTTHQGMPGLLLAELHGVQYIHVDGVFAVIGERIAYYGDPARFLESPVWHEVSRQQKIAQLEAELAELKAQAVPAELAPPLLALRAPPATVVAAVAPSLVCADCGKPFENRRGLNVHRALAHKERAASVPCPVCGKTFANTNALGGHMGRVHARTTPAEVVSNPKAEARS
jgi:hypothetical protein